MARAGGKVILLGEHAVVYGHPAIAAGLDRGANATAARIEGDSMLSISPWGVTIEPNTDHGAPPLARAFDALLATYDEPPRVAVRADVEIPGGGGLGCSAALGVAILRAIDEALGLEREADRVIEASLAWERVFHGTPSGIDNAMAARGGLALFRKGDALVPLRARRPLVLVVGDSGEPGSTRAMVESVARQHERAPARLDRTFEGIASLVRNGRLAIEAGDVVELGKLMDLDQALLNTLLVSTARLEELCALARAAGALGAKLTGGGGGGCMIALAPDPEVAERISAALGKGAFVVTAGVLA